MRAALGRSFDAGCNEAYQQIKWASIAAECVNIMNAERGRALLPRTDRCRDESAMMIKQQGIHTYPDIKQTGNSGTSAGRYCLSLRFMIGYMPSRVPFMKICAKGTRM